MSENKVEIILELSNEDLTKRLVFLEKKVEIMARFIKDLAALK